LNNTRQIIISVIGTVTKVVLAVIIVMWVVKNASFAYELGFRIFGESAVDEEPGIEETIEVTDSTTLKELGEFLADRGLIRDSYIFEVQGKLAKLDDGIEKGTYTLSSAMSVEEMVSVLAQGKSKFNGEDAPEISDEEIEDNLGEELEEPEVLNDPLEGEDAEAFEEGEENSEDGEGQEE